MVEVEFVFLIIYVDSSTDSVASIDQGSNTINGGKLFYKYCKLVRMFLGKCGKVILFEAEIDSTSLYKPAIILNGNPADLYQGLQQRTEARKANQLGFWRKERRIKQLIKVTNLKVLNLRGNNFHGFIPDAFPEACDLETLDLSANRLSGQLPRSLANCKALKFLDVGINRLSGTFPSWLGNMSQLRVLMLRSNRFYCPFGNKGTACNLPLLQIIDISSNKFSGILSEECFSTWKAMMVYGEESEYYYQGQILSFSDKIYPDTMAVINKGLDMELEKILTAYTIINFSDNEFGGEIPKIIGNLWLLRGLNFSRNAFTGPIPSTIGNITQLESLDVSQNKLSGDIPSKLAQLSSLAVLNLSFNKLEGKIPSGPQFLTFQENSFEGNVGLCGPPMSKLCGNITR
ncbi:receptor-like protein 34 [Papaver somniferum]|uniref:receptor-like protein 34 n=1 Tax=Papaver somniferum TaxID=3469 RepID=UPI000E6F88F1|nr:receptor-like protein 34 [Papaver somniferum]